MERCDVSTTPEDNSCEKFVWKSHICGGQLACACYTETSHECISCYNFQGKEANRSETLFYGPFESESK